jgi:hypothetical protein
LTAAATAKNLGKCYFSRSQSYDGSIYNYNAGANPTIVIYNASVVNFYNASGSLVRFENKKYFILL